MDNKIKEISDLMENRYQSRYLKLGKSVKSLGWGTVSHQTQRFNQTLKCPLNFKNKTILDIGCGFGDYLNFLLSNNIPFKSYTGLDITQGFINEANKSNKLKNVNFLKGNIFEENINIKSDIGVMLGLSNLNISDKIDNYEYIDRIIQRGLFFCDILIVDFLSDRICKDYKKESFVFYYNPSKVFNIALKLSSNVSILHNYNPIPQKEFMLAIDGR